MVADGACCAMRGQGKSRVAAQAPMASTCAFGQVPFNVVLLLNQKVQDEVATW